MSLEKEKTQPLRSAQAGLKTQKETNRIIPTGSFPTCAEVFIACFQSQKRQALGTPIPDDLTLTFSKSDPHKGKSRKKERLEQD
jgi:hypothetical protein